MHSVHNVHSEHSRPIRIETGRPNPSPAAVPTSFCTPPRRPLRSCPGPLVESTQPVSPNSAPQNKQKQTHSPSASFTTSSKIIPQTSHFDQFLFQRSAISNQQPAISQLSASYQPAISQLSAISHQPSPSAPPSSPPLLQLPNFPHHHPLPLSTPPTHLRLPLISLQYYPPHPQNNIVSAVPFGKSPNLSERYLSLFKVDWRWMNGMDLFPFPPSYHRLRRCGQSLGKNEFSGIPSGPSEKIILAYLLHSISRTGVGMFLIPDYSC